jgi:Fe-S oxidoreductase
MINKEESMPLQDPIETLENCRFCLMCTHVAPVGYYTMLETYSPHGIALVATSEERELIGWTPETVHIMFSEVDGGNSRAHCVFSQPFEESVAAMRAELVDEGLAPDGALSAGHRLITYGNPYVEQAPEPADGEGEIALFVGDAAPYLWPTAVPAVLKLLNDAGVEPVLVGQGRNSGLLAHSLGYPELAKELAQATLDEVRGSGAHTLLVLSAGDAYAFTDALEERLGLSLPEGLKVQEVCEFLLDNGNLDQAGDQKENGATAYIDPTHAVRRPDRHDLARKLATAASGGDLTELFWRRDRAHPVGSTFLQFTNPQLAEKLTRGRLEDAQNNGATRVLCEDPATLSQLSRFAGDYDIEVAGLFEELVR